MTVTADGRALTTGLTADLRIPRDPAAPDHRWPGQWPGRSALELAALDTAPGCARAHARAVLQQWKTASAAADDALMVVSELVTNAVTSTRKHHSAAPVRLWLLGDGTSVLILVWDATMPPPVPAPGPCPQGRGARARPHPRGRPGRPVGLVLPCRAARREGRLGTHAPARGPPAGGPVT